ncbi:hypothetical protein O181_056100 [Austropuccinia psidii MF-1]|uniref:Uncharacterized protein n=1 Tax=Austropuccinia psidii MF-1 TaxID=1389203 RepID=A0A9Q3HVU0_9BASI|nr:hypothetical protein [Austropuccinia psidii MF-1]
MEGAAPSRRGGVKSRSRSFSGLLSGYPRISQGPRGGLGEAEDEEGEESEETEVAAEPNFLKMIEQMNQFMGQLTQAVSPRDNSKSPALKTQSMKAPDSFDGTQAHKLRGFIQSCQLIFHNDPANYFSDRKKSSLLNFFSH